jgi:hypothetical protein
MNEITLDYPIFFEGRNLAKLTVRRPKVSDVTAAKKSKKDEAEQEVALIAALTGLPPAAIEDLDLADYKKLQEVLSGFFG